MLGELEDESQIDNMSKDRGKLRTVVGYCHASGFEMGQSWRQKRVTAWGVQGWRTGSMEFVLESSEPIGMLVETVAGMLPIGIPLSHLLLQHPHASISIWIRAV